MSRKYRKLSPLILKLQKKSKKKVGQIVTVAANESKNFFEENFTRQGFLDRSLKAWKKRKDKSDPGRAVLTGKANRRGSGRRLRRSIAVLRKNNTRAVIGIRGSAGKYAAVHNFGLRSGRGKGFKMPKRQFIGKSKQLDKKIIKLVQRMLKRLL